MLLPKVWNNILTWFKESSKRNQLVRDFNANAKEAYIGGVFPSLLKSSISIGCTEYRHQFSAFFYTGFRIEVLAGQQLSEKELNALGFIILNDTSLVRRLVSLGWDTLEVCCDKCQYGLRWELLKYTQPGKLLI